MGIISTQFHPPNIPFMDTKQYLWFPTFPVNYVVKTITSVIGASQVALVVKNPSANAGDVRGVGLIPGWEDALEEVMVTHPVFLPGASHG